ncbi:hypothetical protein BDY19DRAFT_889029 [Irpex rosettiformis]|uniref:Uncharacterized protein n=1 Tax=Irpex rosettiformis TaxID=378272 RepID=A0ACB8U681_9APHY|nr:hypothetical protein BDY19DRAFT_889029 [Irpex rosettiformis]
MFSPSLPTAINVGAHGGFPIPNGPHPLQTPMQVNFFPRPVPNAPARPPMHRAHPSVVQLAAAGILPPPGMPMTPLGQVGFPPAMLPPPFVPKSKRTQSISTGGPPKAVLGGPQRKAAQLPPTASAPSVPAAPVTKPKRIVVNLPKETIQEGEDKGKSTPWARKPVSGSEVPSQPSVQPIELATVEVYPPDAWRHVVPATIDVFLPGKSAWQAIKQKAIEEKLEKLGVERGSGNGVPHVLAPHTRAASISSPADPALLFFKLNKLQQSQHASANTSLSTSPQPPFASSPSPSTGLPPRLQNRHGHSMSLAPTSSLYNPSAAFNPFGPSATLGSDQIIPRHSPIPAIRATSESAPLHAPQGRVPTNVIALAPPLPLSRPESKPDFLRGFGLDVTEEEEEPPEEPPILRNETEGESEGLGEDDPVQQADADVSVDMTVDETDEGGQDMDDSSTVAQSRIHSRHVSKLSAALSLRSVGRMEDTVILQNPAIPEGVDHVEVEGEAEEIPEEDAVAEWTGSEDLRDTDDESIGEWSNPSDEERARQNRLQRRILRRAQQQGRDLEAPRRLPKFPQPPQTTFVSSAAPLHHPDDDVISNPSDEEHHELRDHFMAFQPSHFSRPSSNHGPMARALPPLPHSRASSAHFSYHDPALAHSREASDQFTPGGLHPRPARTEALNPLAKPFVFGAAATITIKAPSAPIPIVPPPAPAPVAIPVSAPAAPPAAAGSPSHTRVPSLGKPLNVAAPEFKPGGFTFKPPPGLPKLTFPPAEVVAPRPLPEPPVATASPARATQGREKRLRRSSTTSLADDEDNEGNDTMASFKFPPSAPVISLDDVKPLRHSAPTTPPAEAETIRDNTVNAFTFSGFSSNMAFSQGQAASENFVARGDALEGDDEEIDAPADVDPGSSRELPFPPTAKPKRAPIPLDFKHPVSTNTVPAGLFKALVNGDDSRTRTSVRSRLSSRDIFEHSNRPSLDDISMPTISRMKSRNRLFTDPGFREQSPDDMDVFAPRRASLPPRGRADSFSGSEFEMDMTVTREDMQIYEQRLKSILDEKIGGLRRALDEFKQAKAGKSISSDMDAKITEVIQLFRTQLQDSATKSLDDTQIDGRGEFDFEMLKDIIEQSHAEARNMMQQDLENWIASSRGSSLEFKKFSEDLAERTVKAVLQATSQITMHLHTLEQSRPSISNERETIVHDVVSALAPAFASLRQESVDYDGLTAQLSQAVKPHITQLIDLASDKRETAGLIVERLVPLLPTLQAQGPAVDTEALIGRLTIEMRKILGPMDAHEIKEQVSDLVVERLDSRLAVRDRALSPEAIAEKVNDSVKTLLLPLQDIKAAVDSVKSARSSPTQADLSGLRSEVSAALAELPGRFAPVVSALESARAEFASQKNNTNKDEPTEEHVLQIRDTLDQMADDQRRLFTVNTELADFCQDIVKHVDALPEAMVEATRVLQNAHADMLEHNTSKKDAEEIRRLMNNNSELQVHLAKARGAHGQVRVEKDALADRLRTVETERDEMHSKLNAVESLVEQKSAAIAAAEVKNAELEAALAQALERIKSADVASQESQNRISGLEKKNVEVVAEKQQLQTKVDKLEMSSLIASREKDSLAEELSTLKKAHEQLSSQQSNWDELRRASDQIQSLAALIGQGETEEVKELRRFRDSYKTLEADHNALQKRFREQDTKIANNERIALAARQNLANAQERSVEWERRAKDYEHDLRATRSKLEEIEQAQSQLEADHSILKLQLEERDAHERLAKDRESKLRDQIAAMEAQLARVQADADKANNAIAATKTVNSTAALHTRPNGYARPQYPSRPDSRASTAYGDQRATTPTAQTNGKYYAPSARASPQPSVWASMHAPSARRGESIRAMARPQSNYRSQIPSPTPSNISAAPTLGDDGWYS